MLKESAVDQFINEYWGENVAGSGPETKAEQAIDGGNAAKDQNPADETFEDYSAYLVDRGAVYISPIHKGRVEKRTIVSLLMMLLLVPPILYLSVAIFHGQNYLLFGLLIIFFAMVPFFMVFEGRKPKPREMMVIAVLAAIGVAGRAVFFMVPNFKPIAAIVILTGVSFGGEAGFLVGCFIIMVSNMFMGQGPWTPWQMFAYGLIGFLAGVLFQKGILKAKKLPLCIYGFLSVIFIFGGIMNPASVLMSYGRLTVASVLAFYISGLPVDLVHAASTVFFLLVLSRPLLEKLERIKHKYGLIEQE